MRYVDPEAKKRLTLLTNNMTLEANTITLSVYVVVAIVRTRLALDVSLYKLLHILSVRIRVVFIERA